MIKKIYIKLKSKGIGGLLEEIYFRILPPRLKSYQSYKRYFQFKVGLEIGGPSTVFGRQGFIPVYPIAMRIDNCTFACKTVWESEISEGDTFFFYEGRSPGHYYITEASDLSLIKSDSYDFILSSHCIEHIANPIKALSEWIRVLKADGMFVLVVPHKDGTFDHRRPVTLFKHLIQDYKMQTNESDITHLEEILRLHDLTKDPGAGDYESFLKRSKQNAQNRCLHHHVFDTRLVVEMIHYVGLQILAVELFRPYHIVIVSKKIKPGRKIDNSKFREVYASLLGRSPFPSDRKMSSLPGFRN